MLQTHLQVIRPITTAHLAQTMTLLSLPVEELQQQIESELSSNPALELLDERRCPICHRLLPETGKCPVCSLPKTESSDETVIFVSPPEDFYVRKEPGGSEETPDDYYSTTVIDLPTFVMRQISPELDEVGLKIAVHLLSNLDEDGFLTVSLFEVANYFHIPVSKVEAVKAIIQHAEPFGVGSNNPQEALLVQVDLLSEVNKVPDLVKLIIQEGMHSMSRHQYSELAHQFKTTLAQVKQAVRFISENLNPFPARAHWGDVRQPTPSFTQVYHQPDIIIRFLNDDPAKNLIVEIILPIYGTLRVNPIFKKAIQQAESEKKEEWKNDLERASLLVKCLQQRNNTMQRLLQRIVSLQRDFIMQGDRFIKPITRAQISRDLEVHESTISRAVANKTVQLPNKRIIPLSDFFDRSLHIRTVLRDMIETENAPLSDAQLASMLAKEGFQVARRTVAKYRSMEGILPAHLRSVQT